MATQVDSSLHVRTYEAEAIVPLRKNVHCLVTYRRDEEEGYYELGFALESEGELSQEERSGFNNFTERIYSLPVDFDDLSAKLAHWLAHWPFKRFFGTKRLQQQWGRKIASAVSNVRRIDIEIPTWSRPAKRKNQRGDASGFHQGDSRFCRERRKSADSAS